MSETHPTPGLNLGHTTETDASRLAEVHDILLQIEKLTRGGSHYEVLPEKRINELAQMGLKKTL